MLPAFFDIAQLSEPLNQGALVLAANQRLAGQIELAYLQQQSASHAHYRPTASVSSFESWVESSWQQLLLRGELDNGARPLSAAQELLLWEDVIAEHSRELLLRPHASAKVVQSAYRSLRLWQAPHSGQWYQYGDAAYLAKWIKAYRTRCAQHGLIDYCGRVDRLVEAFGNQRLEPVAQILLIGFQTLPPRYLDLVGQAARQYKRIDKSGGVIADIATFGGLKKSNAVTIEISTHASAEKELAAAARWCARKAKDPHLRIGVIVPDLNQSRALVESIFSAELEPDSVLPSQARQAPRFNISAGLALPDYPLISSALGLLNLNRREFETTALLELLQSPFLLDQATAYGKSLCLQHILLDNGRPLFSLKDLLALLHYRIASGQQDPQLKSWHRRLTEFVRLGEQASDTAVNSNSDTGAHESHCERLLKVFKSQLALFGWPGGRTLDSVEYQQLQRWNQALLEFSRLHPLQPNWSPEQALVQLRRYLGSISFQPQNDATGIQILGMLEGAGLEFDALWLSAMHDEYWPSPAKPNPFIPVALQKQFDMPHASSERELEFSRALLSDYLHSAAEVQLSYAVATEDRPLRPSSLLTELETAGGLTLKPVETEPVIQDNGPEAPLIGHPLAARIRQGAPVERFYDNQGPALGALSAPLPGGSQILKSQAACPFQAYARFRLNARELEQPRYYLDARQRGNSLHKALETFWRNIQATLQQATDPLGELDDRLAASLAEQAAAESLKALQAQRPDIFNHSFTALETRRIAGLLLRSLQLERQRPPFQVLSLEQGYQLEIGGLILKVRIDRIDSLADGSLLIIDYKTGKCSLSHWQSERPQEPQLPLYAVTAQALAQAKSDNAIGAMAFLEINAERIAYQGVAKQAGIAAGIATPDKIRGWTLPHEWADLLRHWQNVLDRLARDFAAGQAQVDPKSVTTCQTCDLHAFCRIHELRLLTPQAEDETYL